MNRKTLITLTAVATLMASGSAIAQTTDELVDQILNDYPGYDFSEVSIRRNMFRTKVQAEGNGIEVSRTYSPEGVLVSESVEDGATEIDRRYDSEGNLVSENIDQDGEDDDQDSGLDDESDDEDDDGSDDQGDDEGDDEDGGDDNGGDDNGGDDESDDDEDDD